MFSLASSPPQCAQPLSQLTNAWKHFRSVASGLYKPRQPIRRFEEKAASFHIGLPATEENLNIAELNISVKQALNDLGLSELASGFRIEQIQSPDIKKELIVTASSLDQPLTAEEILSKHTVFSHCESKSFPAIQISVPAVGHLLSRQLLHGSRTSSLLQHARGFKTKRSEIAGLPIGQRTDDSTKKTLRDTVFGPVHKKKPDQLSSLIHEYEGTPEVQEKLRIAFAEGYAANAKKDAEPRPTFQQRLMRLVMWGLAFYLVVSLWQLLAQVYFGVGGRVKLNPLKDDGFEALNPEDIKVTFKDVLGCDEAKQELLDVVSFLKDPGRFKVLGAKLPKGVLLVGPPGIGKTLLARAVAGEANVPFFHTSGSEFDEVFVGTGAKRVRSLFETAKSRAPCVIFIDEIDTVGAKRTSSSIHPYANQTINQLLSEMDGFTQNEGVIVLGATNRRDNLDRALLRPGRFDVEVRVFPPDLKGRTEIIRYYLTKIKVGKDIDPEALARGTTGCTGADLENIVNQAALKAALDGVGTVSNEHIDFARDKVLMGPAKKFKIPDDETNLCTAYHEAGHTLVAYYTKNSVPLHKVTIVPRGMSLGHTSFIPEKEQYNHTRSQLLAQMDVAMGGRVAEELIFGVDQVTTGAGSDFQAATSIASAMVKQFGMSESIGQRVFSDEASDSGLSFVKVNELSPAMQEAIDNEIKRLLQESYDRAKNILKIHQTEHKNLAQALLKFETLDVDDIRSIIQGRPINRLSAADKKNNVLPIDKDTDSTAAKDPAVAFLNKRK